MRILITDDIGNVIDNLGISAGVPTDKLLAEMCEHQNRRKLASDILAGVTDETAAAIKEIVRDTILGLRGRRLNKPEE